MNRDIQYRKIADKIVTDCRRKHCAPGHKLPQVRELAKEHGVSVFTAAKALEHLEKLGLVHRKWAVGCFLAEPKKLKTNRPYSIALLLDPEHVPHDGWNHELLQAILDSVKQAGLQIHYLSWRPDLALGMDVDGLVVTSGAIDLTDTSRSAPICKWLKDAAVGSLPIVTVDFDLPGVNSVMIDNVRAMEQVGRYLLDLGHRKIAYLHVPGSWNNSEERLAGLRQALAARGITHEDELVWITRPSPRTAREKFPDFRKTHDFSAICCFEDLSASGIIKACLETGVNVPKELSVVGFGNLGLSDISSIALTSVDVRIREIGATVARVLLDKLQGGSREPQKARVQPQLIVRDSTGPAAGV